MKLNVNLPTTIEVRDYHAFSFLQCDMRNVIPGIKIIEVGFNNETGKYVGFIYVGNLKDSTNKRIFNSVKKMIKDNEESHFCGGKFLQEN